MPDVFVKCAAVGSGEVIELCVHADFHPVYALQWRCIDSASIYLKRWIFVSETGNHRYSEHFPALFPDRVWNLESNALVSSLTPRNRWASICVRRRVDLLNTLILALKTLAFHLESLAEVSMGSRGKVHECIRK